MSLETSHENETPAPGASKLLTEFGPLLVFFGVNAWVGNDEGEQGILWATGAFMAALAAAIVATRLRRERIPAMTLFTGAVVLVFGGLTLWLQDEVFIKVKVTILNTLFGLILLFGLATRRNFLETVLGQAFRLDAPGWRALTVRYAAFFLALAALNEAVWRNVSTDTWVSFKVFGLMGLTLVFTVCQLPLLQRHQLEEAEAPAEPPARAEPGDRA